MPGDIAIHRVSQGGDGEADNGSQPMPFVSSIDIKDDLDNKKRHKEHSRNRDFIGRCHGHGAIGSQAINFTSRNAKIKHENLSRNNTSLTLGGAGSPLPAVGHWQGNRNTTVQRIASGADISQMGRAKLPLRPDLWAAPDSESGRPTNKMDQTFAAL
jgi:hypothetical protein